MHFKMFKSPPCGDKPGRAICGAPFGTRHPIPKKPKKDDEEEDEDEEEVDEEEIENRKKRDREARKKAPEPKVQKLLNRDPQCSIVSEKEPISKSSEMAGASSERKLRRSRIRKDKKGKIFKKDEEVSESEYDTMAKNRSGPESSLTLQNRLNSKNKLGDKIKKEGAHGIEDEEITRKRRVKEIKNQWNKMKKTVNKFAVTPSILPEELPRVCNREVKAICVEDSTEERKMGQASTKEGPFGLRRKSEQELAPEKTLVYLVEPIEPVERIPVRAGGKPCKCRENRNAKKILLYGVSGTTKEEKGKRGENLTRVIDGLIYITPTPSPRNSDEYIPEYELYDSPYEKCSKKLHKNDNLKYIERYLGPQSIMPKKHREPCNCSSTKNKVVNDAHNQGLEINDTDFMTKDSIGKSKDKRLTCAFQDEGLSHFYSRCRDNVPCWLRCAEFSKDGCCIYPRNLVVKKPVCECKYERKIVKRQEEKENWLRRQERLKNHKKLAYSEVAGLSRPMRTETNLVISDVKKIPTEVDNVDDFEYCVTGITQNRVMGSAECILSGIGMHTPLSTPEPSKNNLSIVKDHRHWSPMNIHAQPESTANKTHTIELKDVNQSKLRNDYSREAEKRFAADDEYVKNRKPDFMVNYDKSLGKSVVLSKEEDKKVRNVSSMPANIQRSDEATRSLHRSLRKKSATKLTGDIDKISIRKRKSTESIISRNGKSDSHNKIKEHSHKTDMKELLKIELEKMANEGFLFAKLHACWQFPQLQYWLMYRKGIALPPEEKQKLMERSLGIWSAAEKQNPKKVQAPKFEVPQEIMDSWNYDEADKIKHEIALKKETFHSHVRKGRVLQARNMWGTMEFGKFPGVSFKKAYFTYQASKESDGFVFKPWENN